MGLIQTRKIKNLAYGLPIGGAAICLYRLKDSDFFAKLLVTFPEILKLGDLLLLHSALTEEIAPYDIIGMAVISIIGYAGISYVQKKLTDKLEKSNKNIYEFEAIGPEPVVL